MAMEMRQQQRLATQLKQTIKITPRIQQALRILQIPTLELEQEIRHELETNPLLEQVEVGDDLTPESDELSQQEEEEEVEPPDWSEFFNDQDTYEGFRPEKEEREFRERTPVHRPRLHESLMEQVRLVTEDQEETEIAEYVIGNIDDNGRLQLSPEEIAELLKLDVEKVRKVVRKIQHLDPPGVGARDLQECLQIQLRAKGMEDSLAMRIVTEQFENLTKRKIHDIARQLHVSVEEVQEALDVISKLDPFPGRELAVDDAPYIYPDLIVEKVDGEYEVYLNDRNIPRLRISSAYRDILRGDRDPKDGTRKYVEKHLKDARWVISSVERRRRTMVNVMKTIVELQRDFFDKGIAHLKPMVLQDVASRVGVHEATVARVTKDKYVQTPRGVFPLKFFFSPRITRRDGEDKASKAVQARIRELIENEDKKHPLSDDRIAKILNEEGFNIKRRTVAKYRDQMGILNARMRRRV
jgi:RNA polymerase sigma-54 factor